MNNSSQNKFQVVYKNCSNKTQETAHLQNSYNVFFILHSNYSTEL